MTPMHPFTGYVLDDGKPMNFEALTNDIAHDIPIVQAELAPYQPTEHHGALPIPPALAAEIAWQLCDINGDLAIVGVAPLHVTPDHILG